jgi:ABC-type phosphate/phosphonate transport system permease subunit
MEKKTSRTVSWISLILLIFIGGFVLYTIAALKWSYSSGERAGYVQKFSKKGWVCKTWEGELVMVSMPGTMSEKFIFSVRSDAVAEQISKAAGKKVVLLYEQHKGLPTSCFGETEYFITEVRIIE